jgi:hypothetical protein
MAVRNDPSDPARLEPEDRVAEIASILAAGVLRLRSRSALIAENRDVSTHADSGRNCLEVCRETRLHGHHG